tara:strand:- start:1904 stop:2083 length:180 start_codon:yes stop_codon:yes gene_type:complete
LIQVDALDDARTLNDIVMHSARADVFNGANSQMFRDGLDNVVVRTLVVEEEEVADEIQD